MSPEKKIAQLEQKVKILERMMEDQTRSTFLAHTQLDHSNNTLEQFAYVASHHLQEPLRMVSSYLQLIEKRCPDKLDNESKEFIGFALEGSQRMKQLILNLLEYVDISTHPKEQAVINSETALKLALSKLESAIAQTKAQVTYDALPTVIANESQLQCLFQNLIGNAIKYKDKNTTPKVHISAQKTSSAWDFSVQDNGIGISKEYFDKIFLIFQRLHGNNEYPGTGIGLSICQKIIQHHGGKIWVESEPGKGSNFQFTLLGS